jgi:RND family efflux transporter MFP subunit
MLDEPAPGPDERLSRNIHRYGWLLLLLAILLAVWGVTGRILVRNALAKEAARDSVISVVTIAPSRTQAGEELVLPGSVQAFIEAPIYARTSGYLKSWYTDIGASVHKGQTLAEIETPEVDQQLRQAQADLETARANEALAVSTNKRWQELLTTESVSRQDADEKAGDLAAKSAALASAAANVARLKELESFKRVTAPFDAVVTARNTDIGALINAGQSAGSELFRVADTSRLRVYVQVPEQYAAATRPGLRAELHFAERGGKSYDAQVVRTSNALDPALRTLQVELQLDNTRRELFPGAYAEVHFKLAGDPQTLRLPANTVLFRSAGLQVATVDSTLHIRLKNIVQGRDFGNMIEVLSGIEASDKVVLNPPDSTVDGMPVHVAASPGASSGSGKASS